MEVTLPEDDSVRFFLLILRFRFSHPIQKDYCY